MKPRRIAATLAAVLAATLVAAPAVAYMQTRAAGSGKGLSWPVPNVPWYLNPDWPDTAPSCSVNGGAPTFTAVRSSFAAWEQSCASLQLVEAGTTGETRTGIGGSFENLVLFRRGWCSQNAEALASGCFDDPDVDCGGLFGCFEDESCQPNATDCLEWRTVALTSVLYEPDTGRMLDADIEVNGWDGSPGTIITTASNLPRHGWYFTCYDESQPGGNCASYGDDNCRGMDLRNTMTHEVGHFVGLAHVTDQAATMYGQTGAGETTKRSLTPDDVDGVCAIYGEGSGGDGGCGCGSGGAGGALALLVAGLALRRRRA